MVGPRIASTRAATPSLAVPELAAPQPVRRLVVLLASAAEHLQVQRTLLALGSTSAQSPPFGPVAPPEETVLLP
jgi:hypothetical protein